MRRLLPVWLGAFAIAAAVTPACAEIVKGPYLQNPGIAEITVMWVTDAPGDAVLRYGENGLDKSITVKPGEPVTHEKTWQDKALVKSWFYEVRLGELKPGTVYRYQVQVGDAKGRESSFRTVPANVGKFTFIVYGDSRGFGPGPHPAHANVVRNFDRHKPDFIIHSGDIAYNGSRHYEWKSMFFDPLHNVIDHIPIYAVRGNHEGRGPEFARFFCHPGNELYYSFDHGNVHFTVLDEVRTPEMRRWCERDLAASKATWKFVHHHCPTYDLGRNLGSSMLDYQPMFRKYGVDLVISSRTHSYQRFFPLRPSGDKTSKPITCVVTAGGGAMLYGGLRTEHPYLAAGSNGHHYMVFTVEGKRLSAEVFDADGKRIDRFSIVQEGRTYAKEYLALTKDELPLQVWFFHHGYLLLGKRDATLAKGGPLELEIIRGAGGFSDELPADMNITFAIAPQSKAHYRIEGNVVRTVFRKDQKRIRSLMMTVVPLVDVTRKGSTPKPELFLEVTYECGAIKGKLVMKPHWIWNR